MKFLEVKLLEAGLSAGELTKYPAVSIGGREPETQWKRLNTFLAKIKEGEPFKLTDDSEVTVAAEEGQKLIDAITAGDTRSIKLKTSAGIIPLSKFQKTAEFGGTGGDSSEKISNKGEVAEGILGASLFAKLLARVGGKIKVISGDDIWRVIDTLKETKEDHYQVKVKDAAKNVVNDSIQYTLKLKKGPYTDIMDPAKRALLTDLINSAVEYANSPDAQEYSEYFYLNGKPDIIHVITDGISESTTKKSDIEVVITDPKTGKQTHQQLNLSVKAGSEQIGQVGSGKPGEEFSTQQEMWDRFGLDMMPFKEEFEKSKKEEGLLNAIELLYRHADMFLQELLTGDYDDAEYLFIKDVAKAIDYFATLNDPNVILVSMEKGTYEVLSFANLESKLKEVDLSSRYRETTATPQVEIFDKNTGSILLKIRTKRETTKGGGTYIRNYIEKGPLLKELASIKKTN